MVAQVLVHCKQLTILCSHCGRLSYGYLTGNDTDFSGGSVRLALVSGHTVVALPRTPIQVTIMELSAMSS